MTLREYVSVVRRRIGVVALTVAVTVATGLLVTIAMDSTYRTSAVLRLDSKALTEGDVRVDALFIERLANTYARIANSDRVAGRAARSLGLRTPPTVEVDPIPNTELLNVTVEADTAAAAARLANTVSQSLIQRVRELNRARVQSVAERLDAHIDQLVREIAFAQQQYNATQAAPAGPRTANRALELRTIIRSKRAALAALSAQKREEQLAADRADFAFSVVDLARPPESASSPRPELNLALGLALGLLGGVALAFVLENLNPTLGSTDEIAVAASELLRKEDDVILGRIPKHALRTSLAAGVDRSFYQLRMAIFGENGRGGIHSLLVTSVRPNEGRSPVVVNLGVSLARSGRHVVLVDADLHEPTLDARLGVGNDIGLTSLLSGLAEPHECVRASALRGLSVVTSGPPVDDPSALLVDGDLDDLCTRFLDLGFDAVLVAGPPVQDGSDSLVLASVVDATILVVHPAGLERASLETALAELRRTASPPLGVVVTDAREPATAAARAGDPATADRSR